MVDRYEDNYRGAGWVWAIVGIIVAALIVWWIAAAVTDKSDPEFEAQTQNAPANTDSDRGALAQGSPPQNQAQRPAMDAPTASDTDPPASDGTDDSLEALNGWNQQEQGELDDSAIDEGVAYLSDAASNLSTSYTGEGFEQGDQTGGGPPSEATQALRTQRTSLEESVQDLRSAKSAEYPQAFHEVATNFVALVDEIQKEVNLEDVREPLNQLHQVLGEISPKQALNEQKPALKSFFDQSATVLNGFADNLQ